VETHFSKEAHFTKEAIYQLINFYYSIQLAYIHKHLHSFTSWSVGTGVIDTRADSMQQSKGEVWIEETEIFLVDALHVGDHLVIPGDKMYKVSQIHLIIEAGKDLESSNYPLRRVTVIQIEEPHFTAAQCHRPHPLTVRIMGGVLVTQTEEPGHHPPEII
jgi:hypothetical protein